MIPAAVGEEAGVFVGGWGGGQVDDAVNAGHAPLASARPGVVAPLDAPGLSGGVRLRRVRDHRSLLRLLGRLSDPQAVFFNNPEAVLYGMARQQWNGPA